MFTQSATTERSRRKINGPRGSAVQESGIALRESVKNERESEGERKSYYSFIGRRVVYLEPVISAPILHLYFAVLRRGGQG